MHVQIDFEIGQRVWFFRDIDVEKVGFDDEDVAQPGKTRVLIVGTVSKILFEGQKSKEGTDTEVRYVVDTGSACVIVNSGDVSRHNYQYPSLLLGDLDDEEKSHRNQAKVNSEEEVKI